jgi:hypothetical protein
MENVPTGFFRSAPDCLSPAWKHVFKTLENPIGLILGLRDKLLSDTHNTVPQFWGTGLLTYQELLSERREGMIATLAILDALMPRTWSAGHGILTAIGPTFSALARLNVYTENALTLTPAERDSRIAEVRTRVFEACKQFSERSLLEELREAVLAERELGLALRGPLQGDKLWELSIPNTCNEPTKGSAGIGGPQISNDATEISAADFEDAQNGQELKAPSADALAAYRLSVLQGMKQTAIAEKLTAEWGRPVSQGVVSRWIRHAEVWIKAGNVLPDLVSKSAKPVSIDPAVIDLGGRQDSRTKRQRDKKTDE